MRILQILLALCSTFAVCSGVAVSAECPVPKQPSVSFLPTATAPKNLMPLPLPEAGKPTPDCPFYQWAWQTFLFVTQANGNKPSFLKYPTFESVFKIKHSPLFADEKAGLLSLAPRKVQYPNNVAPVTIEISDLEQAKVEDVLIDQNGNAIWYAIHVNNEFVRFLHDYNLTDLNVLKQIPADLEFRPGVLELKSAWQIVEASPKLKNYITTDALIPVFKNDPSGKIIKDGNKTRPVTVALLSLHVVGTIEGHPEFIWSTFEHVSHGKNGGWERDVAPAAKSNPDQSVLVETKATKYPLYPVTPESPSAPPVAGANMGNQLSALKLDEKTQKFSPKTPIYRMFPASKSDETAEDDEIESLNDNVKSLFMKLKIVDKDVRSNYKLAGAVWLNRPRDDFKTDVNFSDVDPMHPDGKALPRDPELFGGENRLSNMAMESFTQPGNSFPNCFSCHDTGRAGNTSPKLGPSKLNVSHILSKFYDLTKK
jgi:hypothetical protein